MLSYHLVGRVLSWNIQSARNACPTTMRITCLAKGRFSESSPCNSHRLIEGLLFTGRQRGLGFESARCCARTEADRLLTMPFSTGKSRHPFQTQGCVREVAKRTIQEQAFPIARPGECIVLLFASNMPKHGQDIGNSPVEPLGTHLLQSFFQEHRPISAVGGSGSGDSERFQSKLRGTLLSFFSPLNYTLACLSRFCYSNY